MILLRIPEIGAELSITKAVELVYFPSGVFFHPSPSFDLTPAL